MSDVSISDSAVKPGASRKAKFLAMITILLVSAAGFVSTYLGFWSLTAIFQKKPQATISQVVEFVDVPTIVLTIPGPTTRNLGIAVKIETTAEEKAQVTHLIPRVSDAFNTFLSSIDPSAFEKRGVLEIIRAELATRTEFILGEKAFKDILITEFRVQ